MARLLLSASSLDTLCCFVGGDPSASTAEAKEQVDARSVYVGNVRFIISLCVCVCVCVCEHMHPRVRYIAVKFLDSYVDKGFLFLLFYVA